jgi:hypothetical protein
MKALVALQNNRISKRNEYKNIALVKPEQLGVNDHRVAA